MGGKAGAALISLLYLVIATRVLGPHDYGILILVHAYVTAVCGIVEFPAWQAIVRYGAEAEEEGGGHRLARLLRFGSVVELAGGAVAIVISMLLAPVVGPRLGWPPETVWFAIPYSLAVLGSVRSAPAGYLRLIGRFDLIGLHNMVQPLVRLAGASLALVMGWGLKGFLIIWLVAAIAEFASLWAMGIYHARRNLGDALLHPERGSVRDDNPGIWRFLIASNADITLSELAGRIIPLLIGWVLGPAMAGVFAVAQRATVVIAQPAQMLGETAYSEFARMVAGGHGGAPLRTALLRVIGVALLVAAPVVLLAGLFPTFVVTLIAGPAYASAGVVMVWLLAGRMIALIGPPCSSALSAMGRPGLSMGANLFAGLIFLPALPWLLHQWGLVGAGVQAVGQAIVASCLLGGLVWRRSLAH